MRIWNRSLITLLNPGGLEPEPGEISEFKDRRKAKNKQSKARTGLGDCKSWSPSRLPGGPLLCPPRPPGSSRPGARGGRPGARSGPAAVLASVSSSARPRWPRQPRSAARRPGQAGGAARAQPGDARSGRSREAEGRAEEAARPPARPGPPRARGPRPLRPRAGSPGPWCTCSAR